MLASLAPLVVKIAFVQAWAFFPCPFTMAMWPRFMGIGLRIGAKIHFHMKGLNIVSMFSSALPNSFVHDNGMVEEDESHE